MAAAVRAAVRDGLRVKAVGTGHSFTATAATDGLQIRPERLVGIRALDRAAGTVTVAAGTRWGASTRPCPHTACRSPTWATSWSRPSPARRAPAPTAPAGTAPRSPRRSRALSW
ncbi:FAD-binding protein [Streptomyces sp. M19]